MSGFWWVALFQFLTCGISGLAALALPKYHHFPSADRPYLLGIAGFLLTLALIGLLFMSVFH